MAAPSKAKLDPRANWPELNDPSKSLGVKLRRFGVDCRRLFARI